MARRDGLTQEAGRLKFVTAYRVDPGDHGPAAELYAELHSGEVREIFRYDCFANHPHRHHWSLDGAEDRVTMEGVASIDQGVAFTRSHFCNDLLPALRSLGYDELVADLDEASVSEAAEAAMTNLEALAAAGP
ncbi:MAG: hypothetical protein OXG46_12440 [Chloroflexi bacterium]|nr:hypothetical protein [Chloroflexota bacterium]MCY3938316.1 hypothetical protein [Chloroflexota bacterium]